MIFNYYNKNQNLNKEFCGIFPNLFNSFLTLWCNCRKCCENMRHIFPDIQDNIHTSFLGSFSNYYRIIIQARILPIRLPQVVRED